VECSLKITYANKCLVLYGTAVIQICFLLEIKVTVFFFPFSLLHGFKENEKENVKHNLVLIIYL